MSGMFLAGIGPLQVEVGETLFFGAFFVVGLLLVWDGFRTWQRKRLMQDTPTERVRSAAIGRTELTGTGKPIGDPLRRPFDDGTCLVAAWEIEEWEQDHDEKGRPRGGHWSNVDSGTLTAPFLLDDGTGTIRVEPDDDTSFRFRDEHERQIRVRPSAQEPEEVADFLRHHTDVDVPPKGTIMGFLFGEDRRYTQRYIPTGADLYLLGATEPTDVEGSSTGLVFRRDTGSDQFIVSALSESELASKSRWLAPAKIVAGIAVSAVTLIFLLGALGIA